MKKTISQYDFERAFDDKIRYTVWVGGTEVNDSYLKSSEDAEVLANKYRDKGYDDVRISSYILD
jgi:hypothetical protein|tara:strand:+ start:180 stop:371 length:192 start_codon:yes stop_codon:yes gene_type:complete